MKNNLNPAAVAVQPILLWTLCSGQSPDALSCKAEGAIVLKSPAATRSVAVYVCYVDVKCLLLRCLWVGKGLRRHDLGRGSCFGRVRLL